MIDVIANARGTCPHCGVDILTGEKPEEKPKASKKPLTKADVFFYFIVGIGIACVLLGIFGPNFLK